MELRWTVLDTGRTGASTDVSVRAATGTTFDALLAALRSATGLTAEDRGVFRIGGAMVGAELVVGLPPLLDGAVLLFDRSPGPAAEAERRARPLLELHVVAGPDAGVVAALPPGVTTIGRSAEAGLRLRDPELSRVHAQIDVRPDGVWVADLGSTNGTLVGGRPSIGSALQLAAGGTISLGRSTLEVRSPNDAPATRRPDGVGHLLVNRTPSFRPPVATPEIRYPTPPGAGARRLRLPWPAMFLPLLICVPMALIWRQATFLLFAATTPLLLLGQYAADRRSGRREHLAEQAAYELDVRAADDAVRSALAGELVRWEADAPDLAALRLVARGPTGELWRRRPGGTGFLRTRLGRGQRPSDVVVRRPAGEADRRRGVGAADGREIVHHPDAPVLVDLGSVRGLGIAGPRRTGLPLVRSIVGQLAVGCSPHELRIEVLAPDAARRGDWDWAALLPHAGRDPSPPMPGDGRSRAGEAHTIVVVDGGGSVRERAAMTQLLSREDHVVVWLEDDPGMLPLACGAAVICADDGSNLATYRREDADAVTVRLDLPGTPWAHDVARSLAPLRDAGPGAEERLPVVVSFVELMRRRGLDVTDPRAIDAHWSASRRTGRTTATIGVGRSGPCTLDLALDGPHALVGGTTGSGKSELLRTFVFGLAVEHPPEAVSFVLVDYKGGAAFRGCERLPHVAGLVTDLDNGLAARALTSLRAELRRRERLLAAAGVADLAQYAAASRADPASGLGADADEASRPPLPRLVIVVDEFRVLAEELPDFVSGLVRIATVGRSLGVHLVLATQRPAGVVSAEIRANANLRIALRVRERADSDDIVDSPLASALPVHRPGRAILRSGGGELVEIQVARLSDVVAVDEAPTVVALTTTQGPAAVAAEERTAPRRTEAEVVATAVREAARARGATPTAAPWLPPLPAHVPRSELGDDDGPGLVFGLADDPDDQRRILARWTWRGQLAIAGGPRSGRSTCLRSLVAAALHRTPETHVYAVAPAATLRDIARWPHVGGVVAMDDVERVDRLFRRLAVELDAPGRRGHHAEPRAERTHDVVLAVDGWEDASGAWATYRHGRLVDALLDVMRRGGPAGVHVVVTGERALLTGQPAALLTERLLLRFADPLTATLAGVPASRVPADQPPGRGLWLTEAGTVLDVQVAAPDERVDETTKAVPGFTRPWPVPELPVSLTRGELLADHAGDQVGDGDTLLLGVAADASSAVSDAPRLTPAGPEVRPGTVASVLGPPGSGRSTALATLAAAARAAGRRAILVRGGGRGDRRPAVAPGVVVIDPLRVDATTCLAAAVESAPRPVILVDDAGEVDDALGLAVLDARSRASVVVATTAADVLGSYGGLLGAARKARNGVLLGAVGPADGDALGVRLGPWSGGPPGRGWLVRRGSTVALQVATPDAGSSGSVGAPGRHATRRDGIRGRARHAPSAGEGSAREEVAAR